ncbi:MAG: mechanosensitive ion channel family protein, partial [Phycisphaerales bacterium]
QEFNSPAATMKTFRDAMKQRPPGYEVATSCLDLSRSSTDKARGDADKLSGILNRIERHPSLRLPTAQQVGPKGSDAGLTSFRFFPHETDHAWVRRQADIGMAAITLDRTADGSWKFSAETVAGIGDLYDRMRDLSVLPGLFDERDQNWVLRMESGLPTVLVDNKLLGVKYWQWLGMALLIFTGIVLDFSVRLALTIVSRRVISRKGGEAARDTVRKTVRPFGLAVAALFWLGVISLLDLPADVLKILLPAVRFFAMLAGVWAGFRVTDLVSEVLQNKAAATETKFDDLLVPLIRKAVKVVILVFGVIYIADALDIKITPLLTALGIGGVGFAFAAKDTLENLFGSLTVVADQPFQVGDWVVIDGKSEGTVENVGFRSSRIRTGYNSLLTIPNGNLVRAIVDNYGKRKYRRWKAYVSLTYDTPPDKIEAFCEGIRELIRLHPYTRKDYYQVWLHQFSASSLDVLVYVFHQVPDYTTELRERHRIMLDIIRLANHLGVEFAFPTQTLHLFQESHESTSPPPPAPGGDDDGKAMARGRQAVRALTAAADWREDRPGPYVFTQASKADDATQIESKTGGD